MVYFCFAGGGSASVLSTKEGSNHKHFLVITKKDLSRGDCEDIVKEFIVRAGMSLTEDNNLPLGPQGYKMREVLNVATQWVTVECSCAVLELYIHQASIEKDLISALEYVDKDLFNAYLRSNDWDYDSSCSICIVKRGGDHNQTFGDSGMVRTGVDVGRFFGLIDLIKKIEPTVRTN